MDLRDYLRVLRRWLSIALITALGIRSPLRTACCPKVYQATARNFGHRRREPHQRRQQLRGKRLNFALQRVKATQIVDSPEVLAR